MKFLTQTLFTIGVVVVLTANTFALQNQDNPDNRYWFPLGDGIPDFGFDIFVGAITGSGDQLFVGGFFFNAGEVNASRIALLNISTSSWQPLGDGVRIQSHSTRTFGDNQPDIDQLSSDAEHLDYDTTPQGDPLPSSVSALAASGDHIFVGGRFNTAGQLPANNIARYNRESGTWQALGEGVGNVLGALEVSGDNLYVGGSFLQAGGISANRIVRYNITDDSWHPLGDGIKPTGIASVRAIAASEEYVFAGGRFSSAGGKPAGNIARYNLADSTWHALGAGVNNYVEDLKLIGNDLYVGGWFTEAGGAPANYIARYNITEDSWHSVGDGLNDSVYALTVIENNLYLGGRFTEINGVKPANHIARYDIEQNSWHSLGDGVRSYVLSLNAYGDNLYVGGFFNRAGGKPANRIARWSGPELNGDDNGNGPVDIPETFILNQNFPNPFNPNTFIEYTLAETSEIRLEVYSITGQRIASLLSGQQDAGRHVANFDATGLSSGIYFYRLSDGTNMQTRKMTLIK